MASNITFFEERQIRRSWDKKTEQWYFSVVDIVQILTDQLDFTTARKYWNKLSERLRKEKSEVVTKCHRLKLVSTDGKYYATDVADVETLLRIIQSIPSSKAEPIKLWLAKIGYERMQETVDPEKSINRGRENWQKWGRSEKWIQQRMMGQEIRNNMCHAEFISASLAYARIFSQTSWEILKQVKDDFGDNFNFPTRKILD